jgi:hypothetical protein
MKLSLGAICIVSACVAACGYGSYDRCEQRELKHYDEALSQQLTKNGTPNVIKPDKGVCVPAKYAPQLDVALRQVDNYFHEVADLLKDSCQEHAFVEWATKERLRFEVRDTIRSDGSPGGRMFLLRSFSPDEVATNKRRLSADAPRGASCPSEKPK